MLSSFVIAALAQASEPIEDNGDGTYSYVHAVAYAGPLVRVSGSLTLQHVGPARYAYTPQPVSANANGPIAEWPEIDNDDPLDSLLGQHITDRNDVEWEVIAVHRPMARMAARNYHDWVVASSNEFEAPAAQTLLPAEEDPSPPPDYDPAQNLEEQDGDLDPESYTTYSCQPLLTNNTVKRRVWNPGTMRVLDNSSPVDTFEDSPVVEIEWDLGDQDGNGVSEIERCSGTLFDDTHVITAAHCIHDAGPGTTADPRALMVKQAPVASWQWSAVSNLVKFEKYNSALQARYDWAVLVLETPLGAGNRFMGLSRASDSGLLAINEHRLSGYPSVQNLSSTSSLIATNGNCYPFDWLHNSRGGDLDKLNRRTLLLDVTHGDGFSGGPYYYDGMTPGGRRYVIGVHSGYFTRLSGFLFLVPLFDRSTKGAKVPYWNGTIINLANAL